MGIEAQPLNRPTAEYSEEAENLFRRQLEGYLLLLSAAVADAIGAKNAESSLASKRERFLAPAVGVVSVRLGQAHPS